MMQPVCKRCLLAEYDPAGVRETVQRSIAQITPEERTEDAAYQMRLARCKRCDALLEGLCGICGCYVELRAARAAKHYPHPDAKW
jgi:hypothetical protein